MDKNTLKAIATSIRSLSMDAVQKANSGHPGLPMGCAELGALLYGEILNHYPLKPNWTNRDRFVLSAGHGSMLLYSLLYLCGYGLTKNDLMNFRQTGSLTPGHPEYGQTTGVETTTGPLGAGFSNAVGMAIAERYLAAKFNTSTEELINHYTYVLSGDGCMMEGITSEAASLAGHLGLGKLIVFYDSNNITIEGSTDLAFSEDVLKRYEAYGWQTFEGDAYDSEAIKSMVQMAKQELNRPTIIKLNSVIGMGAPNAAGHHSVHGAPLGEEEIKAARQNIGIPANENFYVDPQAEDYFARREKDWQSSYQSWQSLFESWSKKNPEKREEWDAWFSDHININDTQLPEFPLGDKIATRKASGAILQELAKLVPNLIGGSADLAPSNNSTLKDFPDFSQATPTGRTLHFGVREHAMGGIINGITLHGDLKYSGQLFWYFPIICDPQSVWRP